MVEKPKACIYHFDDYSEWSHIPKKVIVELALECARKEHHFMRITYYEFPDEMSIRDVALLTKQDIEGKKDILFIPDDVSDEVLERNFSRSVDVSIKLAKSLLKKHGGRAYTCHFDRDGGLFETTEVKLKGNNSRFKYNCHL